MKCRRQIQPGRREQARGNHGLLQCPWHNCICIWRAQCCAGNPGWSLSLTAVITVLLQSSSVAAITIYACIQQPQSLPWLFYLVSGHAPGVRIKEASKQPCVLHACSSAPCIAACAVPMSLCLLTSMLFDRVHTLGINTNDQNLYALHGQPGSTLGFSLT